ncbi:MAG TPA: hypothetical protein VIE67_04295 [Rudaea sp.]|jgi:hypothetical protein|uniref:hypothetical protein n=1 Tax=Rudaea sp. TaxID=2136325 RepID=UPI002F948302
MPMHFTLPVHNLRALVRRLIILLALVFFACAWHSVQGADAAKPAAVAAAPQFGGQDAEGLASGRHVMTDCSVTWTDKDGKAYCFSNEAAKTTFQQDSVGNLERARSFMAASNVQSTEQAMQDFDGSDAEKLVNTRIKAQLAANGGVFPFEDALTGEHLKLAFDGIDFTRTIDGYGFFPDVKFHDAKDATKKYLIDYWVTAKNGQLNIEETRIYQAPAQVEGKWQAVTRQPIPWWWIPASEHPGHVAQKRSWEVMSAVEQDALKQSKDGVFTLKDDKTGKELKLKFVDTHQPIRQLDDNGHYFACTDFRAEGSKNEIYDIDFWLSEKDGQMSVDQVRVHKVPELKDGQWVQVPRYSFKDLGNSHVVP